MTVSAPIASAGEAASAADAWQAVRHSADLQFAPVPPVPAPETPAWLRLLGEWLRALFEPLGRALGLSWPVIEVLLVAAAALLALWLAWRLLARWIARWRDRAGSGADDWVPDPASAAALLADADRLAGEGHYGEATHLLLQRSVAQIAEARPEWLQPASTAREIAGLPGLPERARAGFAVIAARVERSLFARRPLDRADWQAAREAYADFALAELSR